MKLYSSLFNYYICYSLGYSGIPGFDDDIENVTNDGVTLMSNSHTHPLLDSQGNPLKYTYIYNRFARARALRAKYARADFLRQISQFGYDYEGDEIKEQNQEKETPSNDIQREQTSIKEETQIDSPNDVGTDELEQVLEPVPETITCTEDGCDEVLKNDSELNGHMIAHGIYPHICHVCNDTFDMK